MFFCIHNGEGAAEIHTVLMISTQYSQIQYLRGILQKYPDKFQLGGTADNSVLGMSLIESTQPDLVIMPAYMNFWNAEDLINYLLPRERLEPWLEKLRGSSGRVQSGES